MFNPRNYNKSRNEEIDIIRDERFVLKGTEDLNIPFKK